MTWSLRAGEVCVPAAGEWQGARLRLFAKFRKKKAGRSRILCCVSGTDKDGRHGIQHEVTRHDRACRVTTPRNMTMRTASTVQALGALPHAMPWCGCTSLRTRSTWRQTSPRVVQGREASMRSHRFHTLAQVCKSRAAQLCNRSAKHACSQVFASIGHLRKYHEVNKTINEMDLCNNNIGDGGAIALGESLRAMLVTTCCSVTLICDDECRLRGVSRRQVSDHGSFCARRLTARQAFVPANRTHSVSFTGYFDRACVHMSVFEFHHIGCGCGCFSF